MSREEGEEGFVLAMLYTRTQIDYLLLVSPRIQCADMLHGRTWRPTDRTRAPGVQHGYTAAQTTTRALKCICQTRLRAKETKTTPKNWHHQLDHRDKEGGVFGAGRQCHALVPAVGGPGTGQGPAGTGAEESSRCQLPRSAARGNRVG